MGPLEIFENENFDARAENLDLDFWNHTWPLVSCPVLADKKKFHTPPYWNDGEERYQDDMIVMMVKMDTTMIWLWWWWRWISLWYDCDDGEDGYQDDLIVIMVKMDTKMIWMWWWWRRIPGGNDCGMVKMDRRRKWWWWWSVTMRTHNFWTVFK